jgi:hypothetical protein
VKRSGTGGKLMVVTSAPKELNISAKEKTSHLELFLLLKVSFCTLPQWLSFYDGLAAPLHWGLFKFGSFRAKKMCTKSRKK